MTVTLVMPPSLLPFLPLVGGSGGGAGPKPRLRGSVEHYANCSTLTSEHGFRLIQAEDGTDHAQRCPYLTEWSGQVRGAAGSWHTVEARYGHRTDLTVQRAPHVSPSAQWDSPHHPHPIHEG